MGRGHYEVYASACELAPGLLYQSIYLDKMYKGPKRALFSRRYFWWHVSRNNEDPEKFDRLVRSLPPAAALVGQIPKSHLSTFTKYLERKETELQLKFRNTHLAWLSVIIPRACQVKKMKRKRYSTKKPMPLIIPQPQLIDLVGRLFLRGSVLPLEDPPKPEDPEGFVKVSKGIKEFVKKGMVRFAGYDPGTWKDSQKKGLYSHHPGMNGGPKSEAEKAAEELKKLKEEALKEKLEMDKWKANQMLLKRKKDADGKPIHNRNNADDPMHGADHIRPGDSEVDVDSLFAHRLIDENPMKKPEGKKPDKVPHHHHHRRSLDSGIGMDYDEDYDSTTAWIRSQSTGSDYSYEPHRRRRSRSRAPHPSQMIQQVSVVAPSRHHGHSRYHSRY